MRAAYPTRGSPELRFHNNAVWALLVKGGIYRAPVAAA